MSELRYKGFALDAETALALLQWQVEMGADEPCLDSPIDRLAEAAPVSRAASAVPAAPAPEPSARVPAGQGDVQDDHLEAARRMAAADSMDALAEAMRAFDGLEIRRGARNFCLSDGNPLARVMIIGEAPGEEEDMRGLPFVGRAGQLLDRMFAAIGLSRDAVDAQHALYLTNVLPWRPPGNRRPEPHEIAMMQPFLARHVELIGPELIVVMGNTPCQAALGKSGILRLRGQWATAWGRPVLPMTHPSYLLRTPLAKREAWSDLLSLAARLDQPAT